jgi:hypothetical protein
MQKPLAYSTINSSTLGTYLPDRLAGKFPLFYTPALLKLLVHTNQMCCFAKVVQTFLITC